jgi:Putative phage metallopeptidase
LTERYQEDGKLTVLAGEVLKAYRGDALNDAKAFQFRIIFTTQTLGHEEVAGKCTKIDGAIRYLWSNDFIILIKKDEFEKATAIDKTRIIVHELHHIGKNEHDEPAIRRHMGDFCEIPAHDKLSYGIARQIVKDLPSLKDFTTQEEIPPTALPEE